MTHALHCKHTHKLTCECIRGVTKAATARSSARLVATTACAGVPMYSSDDMPKTTLGCSLCRQSRWCLFLPSHEACRFSTSVEHRCLYPVVIGQSDCRHGLSISKLVLPATLVSHLPQTAHWLVVACSKTRTCKPWCGQCSTRTPACSTRLPLCWLASSPMIRQHTTSLLRWAPAPFWHAHPTHH